MKILVKSAWGSDDPTKAAFPFLHANAFVETGHQSQIFLLGEAVSVMRNPVAAAIVPVGWPPLREILSHTHALKIPIHVWTACSRARGVLETDLLEKNALFATPSTFVALVEWADKIVSEWEGSGTGVEEVLRSLWHLVIGHRDSSASARLAPAWEEGSNYRPDPMAARLVLPLRCTRMNRTARLLIAATLLVGSGCAKTDWIDRTLVTVDVTGSWSVVEGVGRGTSFELEQQGSTVKGLNAGRESGTNPFSILGPIRGAVAGDVFRFGSTRGEITGELTVSGDEMTGTMSRAGGRALRYVRTFPWAPEVWREVRQHVPWLLAEEFRLRKAGWFNWEGEAA
jgi:predicted peroxiredoxin